MGFPPLSARNTPRYLDAQDGDLRSVQRGKTNASTRVGSSAVVFWRGLGLQQHR